MAIEVDLECQVIIGGASTFVELTDTPVDYTGEAGKFPVVNQSEDGLEFTAAVGDGVNSVTGDGVGGTPTDIVMTFPNTSEVTETTNNNYVTDAEKIVISNTSNTNTGDQDLSGLQPVLLEGPFVNGDKDKLDGIESQAEVNTINSTTLGEPIGSDAVVNIVSLTQAEFDAGTPVSTTIYNITDA